eukprot:7316725-Pyramimonas_sp.AAC.1
MSWMSQSSEPSLLAGLLVGVAGYTSFEHRSSTLSRTLGASRRPPLDAIRSIPGRVRPPAIRAVGSRGDRSRTWPSSTWRGAPQCRTCRLRAFVAVAWCLRWPGGNGAAHEG